MLKINDLNLLRFCYGMTSGKSIDDLGDFFPEEKYACIGEYRKDGDPLWAIIFYDFKENHECSVDIALNLKNALFSRELFEKIAYIVYEYVFNQANLLRCNAYVRESNKKSIRLTQKFGFSKEGFRPYGYGPPRIEGMHIFGMTLESCYWMRRKVNGRI